MCGYFINNISLAIKKIAGIVFLIFISFTNVRAQNNYTVSHYGENEGLTQSSINYVLSDEHDFMYIATEGGINKFSGHGFSELVFKEKSGGYKTLGRIQSLYKKGKDTILAYSSFTNTIATIAGNVIISNEQYNILKHGMLFNGSAEAFPCPSFFRNTKDSASRLLSDVVAKRIEYSIYYGGFAAYYCKDTFVVNAYDGLHFISDKGLYNSVKIKNFDSLRVFKTNGNIIYIDTKNTLYFYSPKGLLNKIQLPIEKKYRQVNYYRDLFSTGIFIVADDDLLKLTINNNAQPDIKFLTTDILLPEKKINFFAQKDSTTIICATGTDGMFVYKKSNFNITARFKNEISNVFYSQLLLSDNITILANNYHFKNNQITGKKNAFETKEPFTVLRDHAGNYWCMNYGTEELLEFDKTFHNKKIIAKNFSGINYLYEDNEHRIWIARPFGALVYYKNNFIPYVFFDTTNKNKPEIITFISEDKDSNYWIGSNNGLYFLKNDGKNILKKTEQVNGYETRFIKCDSENTWVCTYGGGFYLIRKNQVTKFADKGQNIEYIHCIIEDKNGNFWLPTNNGLFVANKNALINYAINKNVNPFFYRLSTYDGLRTNEFNGAGKPPYQQFADGTISLPSLDGLVSFNSNKIKLNFSSTPVDINKITEDGNEIINNKDVLTIGNKAREISFYTTTSFWGNNENLQLEYQVVKNNEDVFSNGWIKVDESKIISLQSPGHGDYKLVIRKRVTLQKDGFIYRTLSFKILPKWYQTFTLYFILGLLILIIIVAFYEWRFYLHKRNSEYLENRIEKATFQLQSANDKLHKQNLIKSKLISFFTHDISLPLQYIHRILLNDIEALKTDQVVKDDLTEVSKSTQHLILMTDNILNWMGSQQKNETLKLERHTFLITTIFSEKWQLLSSIALRKETRMINKLPENFFITTDNYIFGSVIYNILSNSVKYTSKGTINVSIKEQKDEILLKITDTGFGISSDKLLKINKLLSVGSSSGTEDEAGKGIGLIMIKELALMLDINIYMHSLPNKGTTTILKIPRHPKYNIL